MGFKNITDEAGNVIGTAIVCSRGGRNSGGPCVGCKRMANALLLCDFPVLREGRETTCDRRICPSCTTRVKADFDLCPSHKELWDFERGVPKVGPQAAPPLKPFVEQAPSAEALVSSAHPPAALEPSVPNGGDSGQHDDTVERLQQLQPPEEP